MSELAPNPAAPAPTPASAPLPLGTTCGTAVAGLGVALPDTVVPNAPIAERIGVDDTWIFSRTGIQERRILAPGELLADLAAEAGAAALQDAGASAGDLDLILVATASADDIFPSVAVEVAGRLGAGRAGALDVGAACSGFLAAVQMAAGMLESGRMSSVLVIGAEHLSQFVDPDDKRTAALFGDAAGAVLLTSTPGAGELGPVILRADAKRDMLFASRERSLIEMEGYEVFQHAVARMSEATQQACQAANTTLEEIDLFVYHQANSRILRSVGQRLGLDPARVVDCIAHYGNVSAASLPLALAHARDEGRLPDGSRVLMSAFGAGFVWGATVLDWRGTA